MFVSYPLLRQPIDALRINVLPFPIEPTGIFAIMRTSVVERAGAMARKPRAYRRAVRKQQVIKQLRIWHQNGYATGATSYKLAKALGLRPAQTFRDILNEMVAEGDLECAEMELSGRYAAKFYLLTERHLITEKFSRRHISLKKRGVVVGQLEMFS